MMLFYATKKDWSPSSADNLNGVSNKIKKDCPREELEGCTTTVNQLLTTGKNATIQSLKDFCKSIGCKNAVQATASLLNSASQQNNVSGNLTGTDFSVVLRNYTGLQSFETGAVYCKKCGEQKIATCGAIYYKTKAYDSPARNCTSYEKLDCILNGYIILKNQTFCNNDDDYSYDDWYYNYADNYWNDYY